KKDAHHQWASDGGRSDAGPPLHGDGLGSHGVRLRWGSANAPDDHPRAGPSTGVLTSRNLQVACPAAPSVILRRSRRISPCRLGWSLRPRGTKSAARAPRPRRGSECRRGRDTQRRTPIRRRQPMQSFKRRVIRTLAAGLVAWTGACADEPPGDPEVVVGFIASQDSRGISAQRGAALGAEEAAHAGELIGRRFILLTEEADSPAELERSEEHTS